MSRIHGRIATYTRGKCRCDDCCSVSAAKGRRIRAAKRDPSTPVQICPLCGEWFAYPLIHEAKAHRS